MLADLARATHSATPEAGDPRACLAADARSRSGSSRSANSIEFTTSLNSTDARGTGLEPAASTTKCSTRPPRRIAAHRGQELALGDHHPVGRIVQQVAALLG